jgi:hypothetical protein
LGDALGLVVFDAVAADGHKLAGHESGIFLEALAVGSRVKVGKRNDHRPKANHRIAH